MARLAEMVDACRDAGVRLRVDGDRLEVESPHDTPPQLRKALVDHRPAVLAYLGRFRDPDARASEVRRRMTIFAAQIPPSPAPIPAFVLRPDAQPAAGYCDCCGDPIPDTNVHRCDLCADAAWAVVNPGEPRPATIIRFPDVDDAVRDR